MYSPGESNTQYDQPEPQTQIVDDYPEDEREVAQEDEKWAQLVSRSADGMHVNLKNVEVDEQGRFNVHLLGRSALCALQFSSSPRISNKHCMIFCKQNIADPNNPRLEAWIEDLSANGTFINGETKLTKNVPRLLHHRDEIFLVNPELKRLAKAGTKIIEDVEQNSFVIMLNLPAPVDEFVLASRDYEMQMSQNSQPTAGAFSGITRIERSSTVNRLLGQKRSIYDHYEIKSLLGEGTSGHVYHGISKETGKDWAVKIIPTKNLSLLAHMTSAKARGGPSSNELTKEAEMLRSLRHPHIIHLEDIFADNKRLYLVMELSSGGDLFDRIVKKKCYPEHEAKVVMTQILQAMAYLHERNIAHRDIKPENILLVNKHSDVDVKLTDFGLAKKVDESGKMKTFCGTPQYFAPEVLQRRNTTKGAGTYSLAADMWSLGVILFVLLEGNYPFNENTLSQQISSAQYSFNAPIWKKISREAKELIGNMLVIDPTARVTAQQALQSPWFLTSDQPIPAAVRVPTFFDSVPSSCGADNGTSNGHSATNDATSSSSNGQSVPEGESGGADDTAMRSETMNTNVTSITDTTAMVVDNGSTDSGDDGNTPVPVKSPVEPETVDVTSPLPPPPTLHSAVSMTSAVQFEFEKVNLNTAAAGVASPPPKGRGRKAGGAAAVAQSAATPSTTGKRKLSATPAPAAAVSGTPAKGRGRGAAAAQEAGSSKKTRVLESYFAKASPVPASGAGEEEAGLKRRVTRSASVLGSDSSSS